MSDLQKAHAAVKSLAAELEAEGVSPADIIDALLVVGSNAAHRLWGAAPAASYFHKAAVALESGQTLGKSN
jgi:hypothetical protein